MINGCRDCDALTSGRCWRHAVSVTPVGETVLIGPMNVPVPVVDVPAFMQSRIAALESQLAAERARADALADSISAIERGIEDTRRGCDANPYPNDDPRNRWWRVGATAERANAEAAAHAEARAALRLWVTLYREGYTQKVCDRLGLGMEHVRGGAPEVQRAVLAKVDAILNAPVSLAVSRVEALVEALQRVRTIGCTLDPPGEERTFCKADGSAHSIYCAAGVAAAALDAFTVTVIDGGGQYVAIAGGHDRIPMQATGRSAKEAAVRALQLVRSCRCLRSRRRKARARRS